MSDILTAQFVDAPDPTATLRYDFFTREASYRTHILNEGGLNLGSPSWLGEPQGVGGRYDYRHMQFTQRVEGTKAVALGRLSALAKELQRDTNWFKVQFAGSLPAFYFKTYKTDPGELRLEYVEASQAWDITVPLVAEPLAYGARETFSTVQVIQAPADLAGPTRYAMHYVLPAIKGDAPTGLRVALTPGAASGNFVGTPSSSAWLIACIAGSATLVDPIIDFGTGDVVTNISGTAVASVDASYFGGSFRTVTIGAATPNLLSRFRTQVSNTIPLGRYKVLLRFRYTAGAAQSLLFRCQQWPGGVSTDARLGSTATVVVSASDTGRNIWVDLGDLTLPLGVTPPTDVTGIMPATTLAFDIGTASGAASSVNADCVKLVPIAGPLVTRATLLKTLGPVSTSFADLSYKGILDADDAVAWSVDNINAYKESVPTLRGAFPMADPAAPQNLLVVMALDSGAASASGTNYITSLNAQLALDVSYYPRYLHVGDGT